MPPGPKPGKPRTPSGKGAVSRPISFSAEHDELIEDAIRHDKIGASEFVRRAINEAQEKVSWESVEVGIKAAIEEAMKGVISVQPASSSQVAEAIPENYEAILDRIDSLVDTTLFIKLLFEGNGIDAPLSENQILRDSADGDLKGEWLQLKEVALALLKSSHEQPWTLWWIAIQKLASFEGYYPVEWGCVRPLHALRVQALNHVLRHIISEYGFDEFRTKMVEAHKRRHEIVEDYWPEDDLSDERPRDRG